MCFETYATQVSRDRQRFVAESRLTGPVQQPMSVSHFAPNANATLLSGLRSSDPYFQARFSLSSLQLAPR